jgi:hypothetical protein
VGELEARFAKACHTCDLLLGEVAGVRYFLGWVDDSPRDVMRVELLAEVTRELDSRHVHKKVCAMIREIRILQNIVWGDSND